MAEMNVPANAKSKDSSNVSEKVGLVQFVARGKNDWWKEKVEEELVVEADSVLYECGPSVNLMTRPAAIPVNIEMTVS